MLVYIVLLFNIVAAKCKFPCSANEICMGSFCYQRAYPSCSYSTQCMEGEECKMSTCSIAPGAVDRLVFSEQSGSFFTAEITYITADGKKHKVNYSPGGKTGLPSSSSDSEILLIVIFLLCCLGVASLYFLLLKKTGAVSKDSGEGSKNTGDGSKNTGDGSKNTGEGSNSTSDEYKSPDDEYKRKGDASKITVDEGSGTDEELKSTRTVPDIV